MADANNDNQRSADTTQDLVVDGLPPCIIQAMADGTWHVTAQLVRDEEAALALTALPPDVLCQSCRVTLERQDGQYAIRSTAGVIFG